MTTTDDTTTTTKHMLGCEQWRPVAYITVQGDSARARITRALDRMGWAVVTQPTGFHLIQAISGVIDGHRGGLRPELIVIDAWSRGCAGTTIAAGLRDLGIAIPIVLVAAPGEVLPVPSDATLRIVDTGSVERAVTELAAGQFARAARSAPAAARRDPGEFGPRDRAACARSPGRYDRRRIHRSSRLSLLGRATES